MRDVLIFAAGVALAWLCLRADTRPVRRGTVYHVPALARRACPSLVDPSTPWPDLPDRPWYDWLPDPAVTAELHGWIVATDATPVEWEFKRNPSPRSYRRHSTGELRELVYGATA